MATAATAPVIPAAYFSTPAAVFGIGPAEGGAASVIVGASGGGLASLSAGSDGAILVRSGGSLTFATAPTIAGVLTVGSADVPSGLTVYGDSDIYGDLTLYGDGGGTLTAGALDVAAITAGGLITANSGLTVASGNASVTGGGHFVCDAVPGDGSHLVNKTYVDSVASGLQVKQAVRLATTGNIVGAFSSGVLTGATNNVGLDVDNVNVDTLGMRVLLKDQTDAAQNGIYALTRLQAISATWELTRASDADSSETVVSGMFVFVTEGETNADKGFVVTTDGPINPNDTAIAFTQFSSATAITPGGDNFGVQYKSGSTFASSTNFTFDPDGASSSGLLSVNRIGSVTGQLGLFSGEGSNALLVGELTSSGAIAFGDSSAASATDAVALGANSSASAARAVSLGKGAVARVADTLRLTAMPIVARSDTPGDGGASAFFASTLTALTSVAFDPSATGDKSTFDIPTNSRFIPHSMLVWCQTYGSGSGTVTIGLYTGSAGSGSLVGGAPIENALIESLLSAKSSGVSAPTAIGAGTYYVRVTAASSGLTATLRFTLFGLLVENAAS